MPLLYHLLNGATADITTAVPHLEALAAFLRRPECAHMAVRPLVVGDCKMITPAAVAAGHAHHLFYLGPWEHSKAVEAVIRSVSEDELAQHELRYRPQRHFPAEQPFVPYRGVWRPFPVSYAGQTYPDRGLVVWSAGKQRLDMGKRKVYLKRLLNRLAEIEGFQPGSLHQPGIHGASDCPGPTRQSGQKAGRRGAERHGSPAGFDLSH
jgi:hypothetical protein